jgi:D-alanine-D-alanine ligase
MPARFAKPNVLVLYNHVGQDEYEALRAVDPATLDFTPTYPIAVATVREEIEAVVRALERERFVVRCVNVKEDFRILENALRRKPDVVFNLVEFFHNRAGMESSVAALYELHQIPFTGAGPFALHLCSRKGLTKQILLANGVPTPRYRLLHRPALPRRHGLHYPLIVKPAREDASAGVTRDSVVYDYAALMEQVARVFKDFSPPILVEEYIVGKELHVSILGNDPPQVLPIIEFDFSEFPPGQPRIISYDAKWNPLKEEYHRVHTICPAKLGTRVRRKIEEISIRAFQITGCRDYARLDLRLDQKNHASVLEVNPNPDLTEGVSFMESAEKGRLKFSETLRMIVEFALTRRMKPPALPV